MTTAAPLPLTANPYVVRVAEQRRGLATATGSTRLDRDDYRDAFRKLQREALKAARWHLATLAGAPILTARNLANSPRSEWHPKARAKVAEWTAAQAPTPTPTPTPPVELDQAQARVTSLLAKLDGLSVPARRAAIAQAPTPTPAPTPADDVERLTVADLPLPLDRYYPTDKTGRYRSAVGWIGWSLVGTYAHPGEPLERHATPDEGNGPVPRTCERCEGPILRGEVACWTMVQASPYRDPVRSGQSERHLRCSTDDERTPTGPPRAATRAEVLGADRILPRGSRSRHLTPGKARELFALGVASGQTRLEVAPDLRSRVDRVGGMSRADVVAIADAAGAEVLA